MAISDRLAALEPRWSTLSIGAGAADSVYTTLHEGIMSGALRPGDSLIEEQVARQFGISRTPVREALLKLESEGLAHRVPRRGLVVRTISEHELLEVNTVRFALDALAARLPLRKPCLRTLRDSAGSTDSLPKLSPGASSAESRV